MATLGDLKARIISETLRDDLADTMAADLTLIIQKAIDQYANEPWLFNEVRTTTTCVVGAQFQPIPLGWRIIEAVFLLIGGVRYALSARQLAQIEALYATPITGQPTDYAVLGDNAYVWPTPNQAYPMLWNLIADVAPVLDFTDDTSSNVWTNAGSDLITAQSKIRLYRDYLSSGVQDPRLQNAIEQEAQAYSRLRSESVRKVTTGRVRAGW